MMSGQALVQTFAVNSNNDLYLDDTGNMAIVYDQQAILQICKQAALTIFGEMVLQTNQGIPYFTAVWVGVPNLPACGMASGNWCNWHIKFGHSSTPDYDSWH